MPRASLVLVILMLAGFAPAGLAQSKTVGDYTVHYSAFTTDTLSPEVAKTYKIQRSKTRALVNVSVLKKVMGTAAQPVKAAITGTATNLNAQLRQLELREINEHGAIYYIAELPVKSDEVLNFALHIKPEGLEQPFTVNFQQHFFTE